MKRAEPRAGYVAVVSEPSGEIAVKLRLPGRSKGVGAQPAPVELNAAEPRYLSIAKNPENCSETRTGFGAVAKPSIFKGPAKRHIKNAAGALKTLFNRNVVFGTFTLAGSTEAARTALAAWSSRAVELIHHWVKSKAPGGMWVYKWEHQQNGALHLHFAVGSKNVLELRRLERGFKKYAWKLHHTLSRLANVDMCSRGAGGSWRDSQHVFRSNIRPVRKCIKRYLAKYLAKPAVVGIAACPARWWGQSRELRSAVRALRRSGVFRSENWALLTDLAITAIQLQVESKCVGWTYRNPYAPSDITLLIYPLETEQSWLYERLVEVLS